MKYQCRQCRHFVNDAGARCPHSDGLDMTACQRFTEGQSYLPKFHGHATKDIKFDPEQSAAWSFRFNPTQSLILAWDVDHNGYGHFRCFLVEIGDDGVMMKRYGPHQTVPEFAGEVSVKGTGQNDLWTSCGCQDQDELDYEGNVINKVREVKFYPRRD